MPRSSLGRALFVFALGFAVLATGLAGWLWTEKQQNGIARSGASRSTGVATIGGPFELIDQAGQTRRDSDFRGRYLLVYFGYTFCPDVCPTSLQAMSQSLDVLAEQAPDRAESVVPLFITVDPARDDVATLAAYAPHFHERLVALTGSEEQVAAVAGDYRVYYAKAGTGTADYLMDHSSFVYLMDPEGRYLTHFSHTSTAEEIAEGLAKALGS